MACNQFVPQANSPRSQNGVTNKMGSFRKYLNLSPPKSSAALIQGAKNGSYDYLYGLLELGIQRFRMTVADGKNDQTRRCTLPATIAFGYSPRGEDH